MDTLKFSQACHTPFMPCRQATPETSRRPFWASGPEGGGPLISSHMDVHSVHPSVCLYVRLYVHMYVRTSVHTSPPLSIPLQATPETSRRPFWASGPEGGGPLSSHHIWMFIPSIHPYVRMYVHMCIQTSVYLYMHLPPSLDFSLRTDGQAE
jgi:hypothetical protein